VRRIVVVHSCGSCLTAPFVAIWRLVVGLINIVGRIAAALMGLVLAIIGFALSLTIIGTVVGIPLIILGVMLMVRSIF
jgi:hypothetical protein